jgi:hypothetical protein
MSLAITNHKTNMKNLFKCTLIAVMMLQGVFANAQTFKIIIQKDSAGKETMTVSGGHKGCFVDKFTRNTLKNPDYYLLIRCDATNGGDAYQFFYGKIGKVLTEVKILELDTFRDGGSVNIKTKLGTFFLASDVTDDESKRYFKDGTSQTLVLVDI